MPSRNIVKEYDVDSYYHVYNRGVEKRQIFLDEQDYATFLAFIKRHIDLEPVVGRQTREYIWLFGQVDLIAFCLMPNHFHLFLYQTESDVITKLMRAVCSSYTTYFNTKYNRVGGLYQGKFKAVKVDSDNQAWWLSRYIHRNPKNYTSWEWSSLPYWIKQKEASWVKPERLMDITPEKYVLFLNDNKDFKEKSSELTNLIIES